MTHESALRIGNAQDGHDARAKAATAPAIPRDPMMRLRLRMTPLANGEGAESTPGLCRLKSSGTFTWKNKPEDTSGKQPWPDAPC